MDSMQAEVTEHVSKMSTPEFNLGGGHLGLDALEMILNVLRVRGCVSVKNCGSVANLLELGAQLREVK